MRPCLPAWALGQWRFSPQWRVPASASCCRLQPSVEDMQQQRASLEAQAEALRSSATVGLTPGREGQLQLQVARKRDEVAAILGLHVSVVISGAALCGQCRWAPV